MKQEDENLTLQVVGKLIEIRKSLNLTQEDVRFDTGLNIGRIESGKHMPSLRTITKLLKYYNNMPLDEFFKGIEYD